MMYESPVKNFPWEELGTGTGQKFSIRQISNPLFVVKEIKRQYITPCEEPSKTNNSNK